MRRRRQRMDNPARTLQYRALLAERKTGLRADFERILPRHAEFVWEIGCGHGHFLTAYAKIHPERLCIGIDISTERIDRALRKRDRAKLPNLHFIQAEAKLFLETLPADARFAAVFVLFPDPWPKSRHSKHRLLQRDFLHAVAKRTLPNARIFFRTDSKPYFDEVSAVLTPSAGWEPKKEPWPFEFETVFQSRAATFHSLTAGPVIPAIISSNSG
jgi:tRNA (guanine-N7-)-methyltransferase